MPTNFSVVRIKRDILRRSSVGVIATERVETSGGDGSNSPREPTRSCGSTDETTLTGYYAQTRTTGLEEDDASYRGRFDYVADRYGLALEHLLVGSDFNPEIGFLRRTDFRRSFAQARFSPRPKRARRCASCRAGQLRLRDGCRGGGIENRTVAANFDIEFHNSDLAGLDYTHDDEFLPAGFTLAPGVIVPAGTLHLGQGGRLLHARDSSARFRARPARRGARSTTARESRRPTPDGSASRLASPSSLPSPSTGWTCPSAASPQDSQRPVHPDSLARACR